MRRAHAVARDAAGSVGDVEEDKERVFSETDLGSLCAWERTPLLIPEVEAVVVQSESVSSHPRTPSSSYPQ